MSNPHNDVANPATTDFADAMPSLPDLPPAHDEADDWLGYESVHPLTWIPSPGLTQSAV